MMNWMPTKRNSRTDRINDGEVTVVRNKNRVIAIEDDGKYIEAQYVRENGEVVIGAYQRFGWPCIPATACSRRDEAEKQ